MKTGTWKTTKPKGSTMKNPNPEEFIEDDEPCEWGHTERPCSHDVIRDEQNGTLDY